MGSFKSTHPTYGLDTEYPIILWIFSGIFFTASIGLAKNWFSSYKIVSCGGLFRYEVE
jgi:hypothetical protein